MLSQGGQGTRLGARRAPLGQHHPAKTTPGRAPRRTVGSTGETTPASTTAFAGPAPAGTALAHGPPAPLATAGSLGKRPTDPLPGTQGSPAGSRPLSSTPGALAPAPTHFRVQPPLPPRGPHRTRQPRAPPPSARSPARGPARPLRMCARPGVRRPGEPSGPGRAPSDARGPCPRGFAVAWWTAGTEPVETAPGACCLGNGSGRHRPAWRRCVQRL